MLNARTLTALRIFEVVGRLMSFSRAADELCVTTGAISQQIRKLEEEIGSPLFVRSARSLRMTATGETLFANIVQPLNTLALAVDSVKTRDTERIIRLKATPSFALHWLIPRLTEFHRTHPFIRVEVLAALSVLNDAPLDYDIAIDYSPSHRASEHNVGFMMNEYLLPVMSPHYRSNWDWTAAEAWQDIAFLHDTEAWASADRHSEWNVWLTQMQIQPLQNADHYYFNRVDMAIEAAAAGLGVAMARLSLVQDNLKSGRLIAPCESVISPASYWLRISETRMEDPHILALVQWIGVQCEVSKVIE
ncbi:transcriptional regulator [Nitrincola tibetensis]|uniref:Transcriptional regulator n=1 Tax=Nitrincola tibetensis TaxID=2219697 RepID=A0A364NR01_9GAMM|nr:LysR substrate-binding domain-containing protein [Nitrincola tibetensis]RAU19474.1 transcriptional regulator [Nitrincola tibetensis]